MVALIAAGLLAACSRESDLPLRLEVSHVVGSAPLVLEQQYTTAGGERWSASRLRYYLSNFRLRRDDGGWFANPQSHDSSEGYFLIDEALPASKKLVIGPVPAGRYSGIEFLLGVDPERNRAGAQTGSLDPAHGLFWTWKTGYIFFVFEGHSPQSREASQALSYHLGGSESASRKVYLPLSPALSINPEQSAELHLAADLAQLFDGPQPLRLAEHPSAMGPDAAALLADNGAALFRIEHLHRLPRAAFAAPR